MKNVTVESLKRKHKENAKAVYQEIARLGGFGDVDPNHEGGLDVTGVLDEENEAVSAADKKRIAELLDDPDAGEKVADKEPEQPSQDIPVRTAAGTKKSGGK